MAKQRVIAASLTLKDKNFATGVRSAGKGTQDLNRKVQSAGNSIKRFGKNTVSSFNNAAKSVAGLATAMIGIASMQQLGSAVIGAEKQFDRLAAKTAATNEELKSMKQVANEVFNQGFGDDISTITNGVGSIKSMFGDLADNELKTLALGTATISDLWGSDMKDVGAAVKNMTSNFKGLSNQDALDLLTFGFHETGDYANDLLATMQEFSPNFSKLGLDAEFAMGLLINGAGAMNLTKVGDAVKEFGIRGMDASDSSAEAFQAIGLNSRKMTKDIAAGGDSAKSAFEKTIKSLAKVKDPIKQSAAGVALFGSQWEDIREDVILSMTDGAKAVEGFEGATEKARQTMHRGFGARMTTMWRTLKTGIMGVFETDKAQKVMGNLANKIEKIGPLITTGIEKAIDFSNTVQDHWKNATGVIGVVKETIYGAKDAIVDTYNYVKDNWSKIGPVVIGIAGALTAYKLGVMAVSKAKATWTAVTTGLSIAQGILNGTIAMSPLGWVAIAIGAVVAAGVALYQNWDTVKETALDLWSSLTETWTGIKEGFGDMWDGMKNAAKGGVNYVIDSLNGLIKGFNNFANFKLPDWLGGKEFGISIPTIPAFARGTNYAPGGLAQVHERGGEIIDLPNGSRVYPHDKSVQMARNENKNVTVNVSINGSNLTVDQLANEFVSTVKLRLANI